MTDPRFPSRRRLLLGAAALSLAPAGAEAQPAEPIEQPDEANPPSFIARAYRERHDASIAGDRPYGAVVVKDGRIIGKAGSRVTRDKDPTAHAELLAIRDALKRTGAGTLAGAVLYSSSRPCLMCEAAAHFAGVARMIHGRARDDDGAPRLCRRV